jgi:hypothetical protein
MDIRETKFLWNRGGPVRVVPISRPETQQETDLSKSYGACNAAWIEASDEERLILLFRTFVELVVFDAIAAEDAHQEFLKIEQYRRYFERK